MPKRERVVCGPHLPGTAPPETIAKSTCGGRHEEDEADTAAHLYDGNRFLTLPPGAGRSNPSLSIVFYRRQFPVYPEAAPTEAWDMLRLHLGLIVHQAALDLNLPIYAVAAAVSAFHAVFPGHFTKEELSSSPHVVTRCMAACLFLAGKTSETNLKLREAVNCIDFLQWKLQQQQRQQAAAADNDLQQAQNQLLDGTEKMRTADDNEEQKTPNSSSAANSSQESKAEKQLGGNTEPTGEEATKSVSSAGCEEEEKENPDKQGKLSDTGEKVNRELTDTGTKSTAGESQSEAGCAQKRETTGGSVQSQTQASEGGRSRICGIATFSRSSRYLKGYVPMGIREYWHVRQECLREEERLLQALGFSLPLPYLYDVLIEALILLLPTHQEAHLIWTITNDIAATPLPEQFSPPVLVAAAALFAKKLLAVAASYSPTENETVPTKNSIVTLSSTAGTTPQDSILAEAEPSNSLLNSDSQADKSNWSGSTINTDNRDAVSVCEVRPDPFQLPCKTEPEAESCEMTPNTNKGASAEAQLTGNAGHPRTDSTETSAVAADAGGVYSGSAHARNEPDDGMLEVLERLDSLLCGSPEYWTLCKSHERRGLERGGSRWARALPPAALGWTVLSPPNSAAEADNSAGSSATSDAAVDTEHVYPCAPGLGASVQVQTDSTADDRITVPVDGSGAPDVETEDQAEHKRLLREVQEEQRQRKLVYVQVAEACARLAEVYALLLKSRSPPNIRSAPAC